MFARLIRVGILARMPFNRAPVPVAFVLVASLALAACDTLSSPSASPTSPPTSPPAACTGADLEASGIDGLVTDEEGNPLNDILVQLDNGAGFTGSARTGEDGAFFTNGVVGRFLITTVDLHYAPVTEFVEVTCGTTVEVVLELPEA